MKLKAKILLNTLFVFTLFLVSVTSNINIVLAGTYGQGSYGSGEYGEGEISATPTPTASTSEAGPTPCSDTAPGSSPWLYGASAKSSSSILLQFTEAKDPVSEYVLEYGTETGNYKFAMSNIGGKGTTSYLVQSLTPITTYYFRVRAGNGCATGPWSNEISAKTQARSSFIPQTTDLETEIIDTEITIKEEGHETYTVKAGDSLYSIAQELFGDKELYLLLIELNKDKYPSLATDPSSLEVGWVLLLPSKDDIEKEKEEKVLGVKVRIKVVDEERNPVQGANVTLHSTPKEAITNKEGLTQFEDVEPGLHRVVVAYKRQTGEQNINIPEDPEITEVDFTIQLKSTSPFKEPAVIAVIGGLSLVALAALATMLKKKR